MSGLSRRLRSLFPYQWRQSLKRRLFSVQDMRARLRNLSRAGFVPTGAIDGGAYRGDWSRDFWHTWSDVPVLLIEPQPGCVPPLKRLAKRVPGSEVVPAALTSEEGPVAFCLGESNSYITADPQQSGYVEVHGTTLSRILAERPAFAANLLKLDLQGHELQALQGAREVLPCFEVVILEISILRIGEVPLFHEVDGFLESGGMRLYDLIPQYYRPLDGALWQIDAFYVKRDSKLIASREWGLE